MPTSRYTDISYIQDNNVEFQVASYEFKIFDNSLSISLTEIEANHYYNILSCVLTHGEKYWHNFCKCGGIRTLDIEFHLFISKYIKSIERDIKIEKIIE